MGHDRIVLLVSHRFATVRSADVVVVLDQGEVVEMRTHDELMAAQDLYHDGFNLQADWYGLGRHAMRSSATGRKAEGTPGVEASRVSYGVGQLVPPPPPPPPPPPGQTIWDL
jgi:ABC-type multidrug transport system ATPase subunit